MSSPNSVLYFRVHGMDCAEEVTVIKRELAPLVGSENELTFDVLKGKLGVSLNHNPDLNPTVIVEAISKTGMKAEAWRETEPAQDESFWQRKKKTLMTALSALSVAAGFLSHALLAGSFAAAIGSEGLGLTHEVPVIAKFFYLLAVATGCFYIVPKAWYALHRFRPDMNLLMTVAVVGAILIDEWFEGATVSFLFAFSLALESWSVGRARKAVAALMDLSPPVATVLTEDGTETEVPIQQVRIGATLVVKPGEKIPLDGKVIGGESDVNQAPITGESMPVAKKPGSEVFAGTINGNGALEMESTKEPGDTTLAHIIRLVDQAQTRRARAEQWVEKFARVYTPAVMLLALLFLLVPPLLFLQSWSASIYRSLVLLVIACPCALVISTPVSIVASLTGSARVGVLVKGGTFIEIPAHLKAIAMDKTGTLTEGKPSVDRVVPMSGHSEEELIEIAAAMETRSDHPLAKAIVKFAKEKGISPAAASDFRIIQGKGATARLNGRTYWLGSHRYLEERNEETSEVHSLLESLTQMGRSVVLIGDETHVCGMITLADRMRSESINAIRMLRDAGVQHIIMLTGDNAGTAESIGKAAGVDEIHAELLPADKVKAVEELVGKYKTVAMVGDGVNDAPAMARATIGIAMGAAGTDVAIETADIALMSDELSKIPWLVRHSKKTLRIIRQNIIFSLLVKAVFVVLTFTGQATLWAAIAADMGASILVIFNGLRLLSAGKRRDA